MKRLNYFLLLPFVLAVCTSGRAQSVSYVCLYQTNASPVSVAVQTNQVIALVSSGTTATGRGPMPMTVTISSGYSYTGLTNISLSGSGSACATLQITTPATTTIVSNYVPADCVVIPSSLTGNVQVVLETSPDLINWTAAEPGTYSSANGTNRFFRVRAFPQ